MNVTKPTTHITFYLIVGVLVMILALIITAIVQKQYGLSNSDRKVKGVMAVSTPEEDHRIPNQNDTGVFADFFINLLRGLPEDTDVDPTQFSPRPVNQGGGGRPGGTTGTPGTGSTQSIADWARQITAVTSEGCFGYMNRMTTQFKSASYQIPRTYPASDCSNPGNLFWCADLVREAFYLAGYSDFIQSSYVPAIRNWFLEGPSGYYHIDYVDGTVLTQNQLQTIKPGCAIMYGFQSDPSNDRGDHIEIIDTVSVDARGNGTITTSSVNSSNTSHTNIIDGGTLVAYHREVVGIGCHQ